MAGRGRIDYWSEPVLSFVSEVGSVKSFLARCASFSFFLINFRFSNPLSLISTLDFQKIKYGCYRDRLSSRLGVGFPRGIPSLGNRTILPRLTDWPNTSKVRTLHKYTICCFLLQLSLPGSFSSRFWRDLNSKQRIDLLLFII